MDPTTAETTPLTPSTPTHFGFLAHHTGIAVTLVLFGILGGLMWYIYQPNTTTTKVRPVASADRQATIVLGTVDADFAKARKEYQPFIDYVASSSASLGIKKGSVVVENSPSEIAKDIREGKIDLYFDTLFPAYVVARLTGSEPILNRWKNGEENYHSIVYVKKSSGITTLDALKGKMIVFQDKGSTSGYFLPKAELLARGYKLTAKSSSSDPVASDEIGYYFTSTGNSQTGYDDVVSGKAAAAALNDKELTDFVTAAKDSRDNYMILLTTIDVYRQLVVASTNLDPTIQTGLKTLLLNMTKNASGAAVLKDFRKTAKFTDFGAAPSSVFAPIKKLTDLVESEIVGP